jgi:hypothetical protein
MRTRLRRLADLGLLAIEVMLVFAIVRVRVHREPLPQLVDRLAGQRRRPPAPQSPPRLSRAVDRCLRFGRRRPTCLVSALVLFRLLRARGEPATLVVGLPSQPASKDAHAWVELDRVDVGPPPGRNQHLEIARYPRRAAAHERERVS